MLLSTVTANHRPEKGDHLPPIEHDDAGHDFTAVE
jgi:hypothetical protein